MLDISKLRIDEKSLGDKLVLTEVRPYRSYKEGESGEIEGYRYTVAVINHGFEKLGIKIQGRQLIDLKEGNYPFVRFDDLKLKLYMIDGKAGISATATGVSIVKE